MEIRPIISSLTRSKTTPLLLVLQIAISFAILSNSLFMMEERFSVASRPSGVTDEAEIFAVNVSRLHPVDRQRQAILQSSELSSLLLMPGVVSAAAVNQLPLAGGGSMIGVFTDPGQIDPTIQITNYITPNSLVKTLGLRLIMGRDFRSSDVVDRDATDTSFYSQTVILTQALAIRLFGSTRAALGASIYLGEQARGLPTVVIGIVERLQTPSAEVGLKGELSAIFPMQLRQGDSIYIVRAKKGKRDVVIGEVDAQLRLVDNAAKLIFSHSLEKYRSERYAADRMFALLLIVVGGMLIVITGGSIFGMTTLWLTQRRTHIGIRRALGATRFHILRYFLTENVLITSAGIALGVFLALLVNLLMNKFFELSALPLFYILAGSVIFWILGLFSSWFPAKRASAISPAAATRAI